MARVNPIHSCNKQPYPITRLFPGIHDIISVGQLSIKQTHSPSQAARKVANKSAQFPQFNQSNQSRKSQRIQCIRCIQTMNPMNPMNPIYSVDPIQAMNPTIPIRSIQRIQITLSIQKVRESQSHQRAPRRFSANSAEAGVSLHGCLGNPTTARSAHFRLIRGVPDSTGPSHQKARNLRDGNPAFIGPCGVAEAEYRTSCQKWQGFHAGDHLSLSQPTPFWVTKH